ncbi:MULTISPECIES: RNA polymerase subunit sigma-70 [Microlunatus]|uniref:DNA-directed RNA polymerase specialized sigma24 family protein n=1 Tax=Microlunatus parietis TaxID=682979 RepID=A0A7Y9LBD3_9ACTN|nr:RNA polymerase subunit sigma-70 [Microlunatus parietis]NYE70723.1 DNA-directed RNA polymerase specialized sigma24 family protein [Microlunatus parietis]
MSSTADLNTAIESADPGEGLRAVRSLRLLADQLERLHVERARGLGWSWQDIATVLGVSKQAVHKKHGRR